jgi:hypothetical protein
MAIKPTTLNINVELRTKLEAKYPDITFTRLVEMGMDLLLKEDNTSETPTPQTNQEWNVLITDYNKLKKSYREFKDEVDNRLIALETRLK